MNDTKFKIWCMDTKTWIKNEYGGYEFTMGDEHVGMPSYIYVQYTGLKDKNGVEIYDGDIVNQWWRSSFGKDGDKIIGVHKIVFDEQQLAYGSNAGGFWYYLAKMHPMNIEVVGNIHENPELLEKD